MKRGVTYDWKPLKSDSQEMSQKLVTFFTKKTLDLKKKGSYNKKRVAAKRFQYIDSVSGSLISLIRSVN